MERNIKGLIHFFSQDSRKVEFSELKELSAEDRAELIALLPADYVSAAA